MANELNEEVKESHKILNTIIILFLLSIGIFFYARYIGTTGLVVKEYKVSNNIIPSSFDGVKIVHISDIHYGSTTFMKDIKKLVDKVNVLEPDLIVFTGDLIDKGFNLKDEDRELLISNFKKLDNNIGMYAVKGEDDYNDNFDIIMKKSGFRVLDNDYDLVYNKGLTPIYLGGSGSIDGKFDLKKTYSYYDNLKEKDLYTPQYKVILTHEGDNASKIMNYDVTTNLILSGHSHNGQIVLPFYGGVIMPNNAKKYGFPHYKISNTDIYVSSGIGTSKYMYRFNNRPSINLYRLKATL